jgi:hypothetical protein
VFSGLFNLFAGSSPRFLAPHCRILVHNVTVVKGIVASYKTEKGFDLQKSF